MYALKHSWMISSWILIVAANGGSRWMSPYETRCTVWPRLIIDETKKTDHVGSTYRRTNEWHDLEI